MILPALLAVILSQAALSQEHAIFKSVDRGITWTKAGSNLAGNPRINSFGATMKQDLCRYRCGHLFVERRRPDVGENVRHGSHDQFRDFR